MIKKKYFFYLSLNNSFQFSQNYFIPKHETYSLQNIYQYTYLCFNLILS